MKPLLIIANFKSNKTVSEAKAWIEEFSKNLKPKEDKEIVICPSFILLAVFKQYINEQNLPIKLGAQDLSSFPEGPYTGEVNGKQIKEFADYVLIGHSERRINFAETDEILSRKVEMAKKYDLSPIFCVRDATDLIPLDVEVIVYEPVFAIGSGNPDTPQNAEKVAQSFKRKVLYGGSVTPQNVRSFTGMEDIDGVLVGHASLDALEFLKIIENA